MTSCAPKAKTVRITVLKKSFNQEFVDAYTSDDVEWKPEGCCHAFPVGHEWLSDGHMPDGFPDWAWCDIQKYVVTLARGGKCIGSTKALFDTCQSAMDRRCEILYTLVGRIGNIFASLVISPKSGE